MLLFEQILNPLEAVVGMSLAICADQLTNISWQRPRRRFIGRVVLRRLCVCWSRNLAGIALVLLAEG
jgi:hypothetical protein